MRSNARSSAPSVLRRSLRLVTCGGALFMVYMAGTTCPLVTEYFLSLGASDWHFGLLAGLPNAAIGCQLLGALIANRVRRRKPFFMLSMIAGRLLLIPVVVLPAIWHPDDPALLVLTMVLLLGIGHAINHLGSPLWLSWMADLVPRRVLNHYWGVRQRWMQLSWAAAFVAVTVFSYTTTLPVRQAFILVASIAVAAGVTDILLFFGVAEPPNALHLKARLADVLLEPFRHRDYRRFVLFWGVWMASVMPAAAFMQVYALKEMHMPVWQATLIWCVLGISTALASPGWGRLADRYGHRPVLLTCIACKPWIAGVFAVITPASAPWVLTGAFLLDGIWNAGMMVGFNGYVLTISPRRNRSMFIATIVALAGLMGGGASMLAGRLLDALHGQTAGMNWNAYHLLFAGSFVFRAVCAFFARRLIREPGARPPAAMLHDILGVGPLRFLRFPVGLYRSLRATTRR